MTSAGRSLGHSRHRARGWAVLPRIMRETNPAPAAMPAVQPCALWAFDHDERAGLADGARPAFEIRTFGSATLVLGEAVGVLERLRPKAFGALLCDPPYSSGGLHAGARLANPLAKYSCPSDRNQHQGFGGDSRDQRSYLAWSMTWLEHARRLVRLGGLCAVFTDWRVLPVTTDALQAGGWIWRGIVPWDKGSRVRPHLGRYRNQAEYAVWGTNGHRPIAGPVAPGVIREGTPTGQRLHLAQKPVRLMTELLAPMDGPILDPFAGSGTVGVACLEAGIPYLGIEYDPHHFEVASARLAAAAAAAPSDQAAA
jgi:site-specific DNA-methyltransferase (adenine-specific)